MRNYVSNVCAKLQVADPAEAILRAREAGLGPVMDVERCPLRNELVTLDDYRVSIGALATMGSTNESFRYFTYPDRPPR